jgi:leader peptidase (prepilin peptidase)/N-methyltransferase
VDLLLAGLCGLLGLVVGSFLNVVIWRVPRGESVVSPPSACPACGTRIKARDNVPVLSWLLLRGKCRACGAPISARYPLVELSCAVLFVVMAVRFGADWELPAYLYLAAVGLALALIDLDVKRLPDVLTLPSWAVAGALLTLAAVLGDHPGALLRALVGAAAVGALYFAAWFAYPAGMGFGDVKLAPVVGAYLGWVSYGATAVGVFLGFLYGGLVGIGVVLFTEGGRKTKIPFGPFMLAGGLTGILVGQEIAHAYTRLTLGG